MTNEDKIIKNKIENLSDIDLFFDDSVLWNQLEEKLEEKRLQKPKFVWLWASMAASLLIAWFLLLSPIKKVENNPISKSDKPNELPQKEQITSKKISPKVNPISKQVFIDEIKLETDSTQLIQIEDSQKLFTENLFHISTQNQIDEIEIESKQIKTEIKYQIQEVTVMNLPIIPDELMKREGFGKRLFRQIKSFNTEGKIDLRELNIEPRNVWAYLEIKFKSDSTKQQSKSIQKQ